MQCSVNATIVISSLVFCCTIVSQNGHPLCVFLLLKFSYSLLLNSVWHKALRETVTFLCPLAAAAVQAANQQIQTQLHPAQEC